MNTEFRRVSYFRGADFKGGSHFFSAKFCDYANFREVKFSGGDCSFKNAEFHKDTDFGRAKFSSSSKKIFPKEACCFSGAKFYGALCSFREAEFDDGAANFEKAKFNGGADFSGVKFGGIANFVEATFNLYTNFENAKFIGGVARFQCAKFGGKDTKRYSGLSGHADFRMAEFTGGDAYFNGAEFGGSASFARDKFSKFAHFDYVRFSRDVSFKDAKFSLPASQEETCRIAKRTMEDLGIKKEADYYFYREMEAVRIQKGIKGIKRETYPTPANILELLSQLRHKINLLPSMIKRFLIYDVLEYIFIQRVFGYGVRPFNVAKAWLIVVFGLFAIPCG